MQLCVTCNAERDEVLFGIFAGTAAKFFVMDFKVCHCSAALASPVIPLQNSMA
jgi:hypothetical protein